MLELCAGTLEQFIKEEYKGPELPPDEIVLYEIACGVAYIHSMKLVHRDIKPDNILISLTDPVMMKVSDFGLSKSVNSRGSYSVSGIKGTHNWMAPELLELADSEEENARRGSVQSDIFSTGCVFFYFLTRGKHLFGKGMRIAANILENKRVNLKGDEILCSKWARSFQKE